MSITKPGLIEIKCPLKPEPRLRHPSEYGFKKIPGMSVEETEKRYQVLKRSQDPESDVAVKVLPNVIVYNADKIDAIVEQVLKDRMEREEILNKTTAD